jgi:hypothetical protein
MMHHLFSLKHRRTLSLAIFVLGTALHAQQTSATNPPPAPVPAQTAVVPPALDLNISSNSDPDQQPAPPAAVDAPQPQSQTPSNEQAPAQTHRILGTLPTSVLSAPT